MMCFVVLCSLAVHVPYKNTREPRLPLVEFNDFMTNRPQKAIVFVTSSVNGDLVWGRRARRLITTASLLNENVEFVEMSRADAYPLVGKLNLFGPLLLFFQEANAPMISKFPENEAELLFLIENRVNNAKLISTTEELGKLVDRLPLTLIVRMGQYQRSLDVLRDILPTIDPIQVIEGEKSLFEEMNMSESEAMLFRRMDDVIMPCDINESSVFEATRPFYDVSDESNMFDSSVRYLGLVGGPDVALEFKDVLFSLSQRFPDFRVVAVPPVFHGRLGLGKSVQVRYIPDIRIFNAFDGYHYPNGGRFRNVDFHSDLFWQICNEFVEDVVKGRIEPEYGSEDPSDEIFEGVVHKVVGLNYEDFVGGEKPVLMLYDVNSVPNATIIERMVEVAHKFGDSLEFGVINPRLNSCESGFPLLFSESDIAMVFRNGTSVTMFEPKTLPGFIRFLNRTLPELLNGCDVEPPSLLEAIGEMDSLLQLQTRVRSAYAEVITHYIRNVLVPLSRIDPFAKAVEKEPQEL